MSLDDHSVKGIFLTVKHCQYANTSYWLSHSVSIFYEMNKNAHIYFSLPMMLIFSDRVEQMSTYLIKILAALFRVEDSSGFSKEQVSIAFNCNGNV